MCKAAVSTEDPEETMLALDEAMIPARAGFRVRKVMKIDFQVKSSQVKFQVTTLHSSDTGTGRQHESSEVRYRSQPRWRQGRGTWAGEVITGHIGITL